MQDYKTWKNPFIFFLEYFGSLYTSEHKFVQYFPRLLPGRIYKVVHHSLSYEVRQLWKHLSCRNSLSPELKNVKEYCSSISVQASEHPKKYLKIHLTSLGLFTQLLLKSAILRVPLPLWQPEAYMICLQRKCKTLYRLIPLVICHWRRELEDTAQ